MAHVIDLRLHLGQATASSWKRMRLQSCETGTEIRKLVAVKELNLSYYIIPPIMENQMEKTMDNDMETGGIYRDLRNLH